VFNPKNITSKFITKEIGNLNKSTFIIRVSMFSDIQYKTLMNQMRFFLVGIVRVIKQMNLKSFTWVKHHYLT